MTWGKEIRERAIQLLIERGLTESNLRLISETLGPSVNSLRNWWFLIREHGLLGPKRVRTTLNRKMRDEDLIFARICIETEPTLFMREVAELIYMENGYIYETWEVRDSLARIGYSSKAISVMARERNEGLRDLWREHVTGELTVSAREYVFVDESHISAQEAKRRRGWSQAGERAWVRSTLGDRVSCSAVTSMAMYGVLSVSTFDIVDGDLFLFALETDILPLMNRADDPYSTEPVPMSILVMDNAATHLKAAVVALCLARGVRVLFLPPYSFDLNPIERVFHLAKHYIRNHWGEVSMDHPLKEQFEEALFNCVTPSIGCRLYQDAGFTISNADIAWVKEYEIPE